MKTLLLLLFSLILLGKTGSVFAQEMPYIPNIRDNRLLQKAEKSLAEIAKEGKKEQLVSIIGTLKTQLGILRDPKSQYILFELGRITEEQLPIAVTISAKQQESTNPQTQTTEQHTGTTSPVITNLTDNETTSGTTTHTGINTGLYLMEHGKASYYGSSLEGNNTANGDKFTNNAFTAAHKTLPFNTRVKVTNKKNNLRVVVRINDRGPFTPGRIIDLSQSAFKTINNDSLSAGIVEVSIEIVAEG